MTDMSVMTNRQTWGKKNTKTTRFKWLYFCCFILSVKSLRPWKLVSMNNGHVLLPGSGRHIVLSGSDRHRLFPYLWIVTCSLFAWTLVSSATKRTQIEKFIVLYKDSQNSKLPPRVTSSGQPASGRSLITSARYCLDVRSSISCNTQPIRRYTELWKLVSLPTAGFFITSICTPVPFAYNVTQTTFLLFSFIYLWKLRVCL